MAERRDFPPVLNALEAQIVEHLGASLVGLYVYGSLVVGDFDEERSDVDLLAVTRGLLSGETERAVERMHQSVARCFPTWSDRVEVGYFPLEVVNDFQAPLGDVFRISPGEPFHRTQAQEHWLTDLYSVQEHGLVLYGAPADEVLPRVSSTRFRATIQRLVAEWRDWVVGVQEQRHQAYVRLTMFRSLYAYRYASQTSKIAAAHWFAAQFPDWRDEAAQAVVWRQSDSTTVDLQGARRTEELVDFVHERIRQ